MPFPGFHAARMIDPDKFQKDTMRTISIGPKTSGITAIVGRLKGESTTKVASYRFDKDKFTAKQARQWLKEHDLKPITFEEASDKGINEMNDDIQEIKEIKEMEYKTYAFDVFSIGKECKKDSDEELGVFYGAMATEHKDRGNDIIAPDAFDESLNRYKKSKRDIRLFYQHDTREFPIGIIPINSVSKDGKSWTIKGELNLETQRGREIYSLMKQGALSDLSIGYTPNETDYKGKNRIIKSLELWEVSVVSEPMNPKATINEIKGATIFHDLPLAPNDRAWDANAAMQRVRTETNSEESPSKSYRNAFFWFDEENQDNFSSYKLQFADVLNGKLTAVPRGIFAAAAAMRGARGGVDMPSEDRVRVESHINRYYEKMGLESPLKTKGLEYAITFDNEIKELRKFDIEDVEQIKSREEFNELLSKSGVFSRSACEFLASCFISKQSKSVKNDNEGMLGALTELKAIINKL